MNKIELIKCFSVFLIIFVRSNLFTFTPRIDIEISKIKKYYQSCSEGTITYKKYFEKVNHPRISIIVPVFNREKYLINFLRSIQNQNFNNIEIIFVDDFSIDNSIEIIEKFKNNDERIVLLKNKRNKGTLVSRNIAGIKAKGEFLIFPDPDDIMSPDILKKCYYFAKKYNYEFIRFHMYSDRNYVFRYIPDNLSDIINQPDLRVHLIYGLGYANIIDGILNNKFVTKSLFIKSLNSINDYYLKQKMIYFEDGLINFSFYLNAKSLYFLRTIGYYYFTNADSISKKLNINSYYECFFLFLKYVYENTKNTLLEKNMTFYLLQNYIPKNEVLKRITNYSKIYKKVVNKISKCKFISPFFQSKINGLKRIISKKFSRNKYIIKTNSKINVL